jgi:hypothetical protein
MGEVDSECSAETADSSELSDSGESSDDSSSESEESDAASTDEDTESDGVEDKSTAKKLDRVPACENMDTDTDTDTATEASVEESDQDPENDESDVDSGYKSAVSADAKQESEEILGNSESDGEVPLLGAGIGNYPIHVLFIILIY